MDKRRFQIADSMIIGICAALFWAVETLLLGSAVSGLPVEPVRLSLAAAALHDLLSAFLLLGYLGSRGQKRQLWKALNSRGGQKIMGAALLGGPVGMVCYLLAVQTAGAAPAASISALYPAIGAFLSALWLGERLRKDQRLGLGICVLGAFLLGSLSGDGVNRWLGLLPALMCALCWGAEAVISSSGMEESDIPSQVALGIRQFTSAVVFCLILLPLSGVGGTAIILVQRGGLRLLGAALAGTTSYLCYYKAICILGPSRAMALNISYTMWVVALDALLEWRVPGLAPLVCAGMISAGSILSAWEKKTSN